MWPVFGWLLSYLSRNYNLSSLALVASSVWCTSNYERTRVLPSAFQCAVYFISFYTLYFLGMPIVTQQTVTYITINDLNKVAPITTVERRRQLRLFRAWQKFQQQQSPRQRYCSCALSATAMLRYAIGRRVLETFNAECIGLRWCLTVCIATCLWFLFLHAEHYLWFWTFSLWFWLSQK